MENVSVFIGMKEKIKKVTWLRNFLLKIPCLMFMLDPIIPMSYTMKLLYFLRMEKELNLEDPKDFNEKIQWLKVYYRDPLYVKCADKYRVRDYVANLGLGEILNDLYKVYDKVEDINFGELPDRFVMKTNHACKTIIICDDKSRFNETETKKKFRRWLKKKHGYTSGEFHYNYIKPLIIVEKNLALEDGTLPVDYKIFCFNGKPHYIAVYLERDETTLDPKKRAIFDFEWNPKDFVIPLYSTDTTKIARPKKLEQMYYIAEQLSKPFPFVRVDLYEINGKVIFGELTFTPTGGFAKGFTNECLRKFGDLISLPPKSKTQEWV